MIDISLCVVYITLAFDPRMAELPCISLNIMAMRIQKDRLNLVITVYRGPWVAK